MKIVRSVLVTFAAITGAAPALAGIEVSPIIVMMESAAKQEDVITVTNSGDKIAYVTVEPREVMERGVTDEKLRVDPNPATLGLLATPLRMVLEPGERRAVRIVAVAPPGSDDRLWRVKIAPAAGRLKDGQSGVAFLVGYDALIMQRAANPRVAITGRRAGKTLTLTNSGNSFGMISAIEFCPVSGSCSKLPDTKRIYGGRSWDVSLPAENGTVSVTIDGLSGKQDVLRF